MTNPEEPSVDELAVRLQDALGEGYKVERPLGAGGFAVVYLVRDLSLKRSLAIKVLSPDLITSKTVLERFRREAETVAQLAHPNIVPLHFIGQKDDLLYLAMGCIDGGSVADRIEKEGPLPIADASRIIAEVASALAHAHKRGVIHRDIKPQNVLLDADSGRALVTDFGIARTTDSSLTATGMFVGTPTYLAPEQVTGEPSDHRADIYALGVMAYEMLSGRPPFDGPTPTAILMKRLAGPPEPITVVRRDTPVELERVVEACLAADPEQRFQTASDIVAALGGDTARTPTLPGAKTVKRPAPETPAGKSPLPMYLMIGGALVLALVTSVFALKGRGDERPPAAAVPDDDDRTMVVIPAGNYIIGADRGNAAPRHTVALGAFRIDRREVTVGEYNDFVTAGRAVAPWGANMPDASLPVTRVGWSEAMSYCAWRHPDGGRLPTEKEWEAAARGTSGTTYPWGNAAQAGLANLASAGRTSVAPVGSFTGSASPAGVEDLLGNVWEWTSSPMQAYPGGTKLPDSLSSYRVIRGGAFNTPDDIATAWLRGYNRPSTSPEALEYTGFRCAKS
ncbi:MAG TPA: bifunctional serine/threonine-protein kinase/formylglycine-generating enzyme family protein [Gemmatimonadaceae bacterium]|nr:bifunctional serine/threonine-protein kinase/formylglycine-generating enzyme family protein [Gemmatimonadaceae bacterium]